MCLHLCRQVLDSSQLKYEDHQELYLVKLITEAMADTWSALCLVCLVCTLLSSGVSIIKIKVQREEDLVILVQLPLVYLSNHCLGSCR